MTMQLLAASLAILAAGAAAAFFAGRHGRWLGPVTAAAGCLLAAAAGAGALAGDAAADFVLPWSMPIGTFRLGMDALSALFVLITAVVCGLSAVYGAGYLDARRYPRRTGLSWAFYNLLTASMLVVVTARNGMLFLLAWEVMSLASFFLVMFEHEREDVRRAGWTYLVAAHLGTAFLLALFVLLDHTGTLEFGGFGATGATAGIAFLLAVIGFGTKAGFMPMHVWLPEAHPAAPSHVSAVMSGVMIKTGIYGILRTLTYLGAPSPWWGWTLLGIGVVSGVMGVLYALAQHDLKRLLAYHSVENIGIIAMGLGLGVLGAATGHQTMAALGMAGGLLHVANHALFKSLLFLGAGSVLHATGTRDIDRLGGLLRRMPVTGAAFLVASAAICGLPPLNGFVSEFLIYVGSFAGIAGGHNLLAGVLGVGALALIGGLAAACFTKASGIVFLGEPRGEQAAGAHEAGAAMRVPMLVLAGLCLAIGLGGPFAVSAVLPAAAVVIPGAAMPPLAALTAVAWVALAAAALGALVALLAGLRLLLLRGRTVGQTGTWDCGYAAPTARMQYTASSFAQPTLGMFHSVVPVKAELHAPDGLLPRHAGIHTSADDISMRRGYRPALRALVWVASHLRGLQQGRNQLYVLYIAITLLALLIWLLR